MGDFISPLFDAIKEIKKLTYNYTAYSDEELARLSNDSMYIYPYISYILTGRQYPTDNPIEESQLESAKLNLYYTLFNGASISWPKGSEKLHIFEDHEQEPAFPYLYLLLKHDSIKTFVCLNEAFEDDLLNDDEVLSFSNSTNNYELKVNRQYITDVLIGIFNENTDFSAVDKTYLAIFISRNYPKYLQFIRLSDSTLSRIVETLCSYPEDDLKDECELSLQNLLQVFKPADSDSLISMLESAGFYNALLGIYKSENKMLQLLDLWVKAKEEEESVSKSSDDLSFNPFVEPSADIVSEANFGAYV
ncbi:unnamed protein product [Ambrosiozyma monospora]|uniref:Unnamed protein product n=1 Tax=Ambrosiozyma monospora TaxID=43982 RepID=A0ACB5U5C9_AMBMO|nr:unnamed protein product [Ambrosiozyma monospora]